MGWGRGIFVGLTGFLCGAALVLALVDGGYLDLSRPRSSQNLAWGEFLMDATIRQDNLGQTLHEIRTPCIYADRHGIVWYAPSGHPVDGKSIPELFWPDSQRTWDGSWLNAVVLHDVACRTKSRPWEQVHLMLYESCLCSGLSELQAKILYAATYHYGPTWTGHSETLDAAASPSDGNESPNLNRIKLPVDLRTTQNPPISARNRLVDFIRNNNPTLEEIRQFAAE